MKQVYTSFANTIGAQRTGIVQLLVAPREWLTANPSVDFATGKILAAVTLIAGKTFINLDLTRESYDYNEKAKSNKGGSFFDISVVGTLNALDADIQQVIETIRYHELVLIVKDRKRRNKFVGTKDAGAILQVNYRNSGTNGGTEIANFEINMETEDRPPFYL